MIKEGLTIRGAAEMWVREFNAVPQEMIADLMREQIDEWHELTKPSYGNSVSLYSMPEEDQEPATISSSEDEKEATQLMETAEVVDITKIPEYIKIAAERDVFKQLYMDLLKERGVS